MSEILTADMLIKAAESSLDSYGNQDRLWLPYPLEEGLPAGYSVKAKLLNLLQKLQLDPHHNDLVAKFKALMERYDHDKI